MEIGVIELPAVAHPAPKTAPQTGVGGSFEAVLKALHATADAGAQTAGGAANPAQAIAETPAAAALGLAAEAPPAPAGAGAAMPPPAVASLPVAAVAAGPSRAAPIAGSPPPQGAAEQESTTPGVPAEAQTVVSDAAPAPPARPELDAAGGEPLVAAPVPLTPAPAGEAPEEAIVADARAPATPGPATPATPAQRHGAPAAGSARAGAQAAPAAGGAPEAAANDQASPVREAALTIARERLAPGHAARGGEAAPDFTAFRETLASVLPDNAGPGPAEGARATAQPAPAALAARAPTAPPVPIAEQVAVYIRRAVADGDSVVRIRLEPKELGRIDVRLEIADGNRLSAVVSAERADTLALLARDARGLEKALADAGLELGSDGLAFDLDERGEGGEGEARAPAGDDAAEAELVLPAAAIAGAASATGIDIRV